MEKLNEISKNIKKELCVKLLIDKEEFTAISVGKINTVEIPYINVKDKRLSGFRIIHTHPSGDSKLSSMDTSALVDLKLDAINCHWC